MDLSVEDRANAFIDLLYIAIKQSLYSGRKDNPDVRVEVDVADDVFNIILANITTSVLEREKRTFQISTNHGLDGVLRLKWDEHIINICGDYCFVVKDWHCNAC